MKPTKGPELKNYRWKGVNSTGKKVAGQTLAISEIEVRDKLKEQHIQVKKIKKGSVSVLTRLTNRVKTKEITILTRQLATMLTTGVPIVQALKLVGDNHRKAEMKSILAQITKGVEAGTPISKAMRTASTHFDALYVDLIQTGEQSGNLAEVFERLATYREKSEQLRAKVIKALIYPSMVILVALGVSYLMLTMVIPEFESMFKGFGAELPWFTQQILKLSHGVQAYSAGAFIASLSLVFGIKAARKKSFVVRLKTSQLSLRFPIIGVCLPKPQLPNSAALWRPASVREFRYSPASKPPLKRQVTCILKPPFRMFTAIRQQGCRCILQCATHKPFRKWCCKW